MFTLQVFKQRSMLILSTTSNIYFCFSILVSTYLSFSNAMLGQNIFKNSNWQIIIFQAIIIISCVKYCILLYSIPYIFRKIGLQLLYMPLWHMLPDLYDNTLKGPPLSVYSSWHHNVTQGVIYVITWNCMCFILYMPSTWDERNCIDEGKCTEYMCLHCPKSYMDTF